MKIGELYINAGFVPESQLFEITIDSAKKSGQISSQNQATSLLMATKKPVVKVQLATLGFIDFKDNLFKKKM